MPAKPKPTIQTFLLADHVYQDVITKKHIICGTFSTFTHNKPKGKEETDTGERKVVLDPRGEILHAFAYVNFTNAEGEYRFDVRYNYLRDSIELFRTTEPFVRQATDRFDVNEFYFPLPAFPCVDSGAYALDLYCDEEMVTTYRLKVEVSK